MNFNIGSKQQVDRVDQNGGARPEPKIPQLKKAVKKLISQAFKRESANLKYPKQKLPQSVRFASFVVHKDVFMDGYTYTAHVPASPKTKLDSSISKTPAFFLPKSTRSFSPVINFNLGS